jgi:hypothetical protein
MKEGGKVEPMVDGDGCSETREEAVARLKALKRPLPKGFRFDRAEANER